MVELPYGRIPYPVDLAGRAATLVTAPRRSPPRPLSLLLDEALDAPLGSAGLEALVRPGQRVCVILSDATRAEPRGAFVKAIRRRLGDARVTFAIATGTHGPSALGDLGLAPADLADATIVNHDGHREDDLVDLGRTARGTPIRVHRCVVETDLVIATGCIRPHYFAGFGAGVKAIFPGLAHAGAIRINHALKTDDRARAGIVDGNPCREDLEEAAGAIATPTFLLDGVAAPDGEIHAVVAGALAPAFRAGVELARAWFTVRAPRAPIVIASDVLPVSASLYQAAKIAAAVAPLVEPDGKLVLVAECPDGIGPVEVVNEAIFRIGVLPRLAPGVSIHLVSGLSRNDVACTLTTHAESVDAVLQTTEGRIVIVPFASQLIIEASS